MLFLPHHPLLRNLLSRLLIATYSYNRGDLIQFQGSERYLRGSSFYPQLQTSLLSFTLTYLGVSQAFHI